MSTYGQKTDALSGRSTGYRIERNCIAFGREQQIEMEWVENQTLKYACVATQKDRIMLDPS